jgi:hypothetical protein
MIRAGSFREDLYYRLNAIELRLPPLAERPGDILPLAEHFLPDGKPLGAARAARCSGTLAGQRARTAQRHPARGLLATGDRIEAWPTSTCRARRPCRGPVRAEPERATSKRRCNAPAA